MGQVKDFEKSCRIPSLSRTMTTLPNYRHKNRSFLDYPFPHGFLLHPVQLKWFFPFSQARV